MDSLNRHMLSAYRPTWVLSPNIQRFAERSMLFTNHWLGSAPCMPARRDIMTGRLQFLEKGWGAIEPFDITLPDRLRAGNVVSHMITDHYHYLEIGSENYCQLFDTWELYRGQESDPWVSQAIAPEIPTDYYGRIHKQYEKNRIRFRSEEDFPGPQTLNAACRWLRENAGADNYFLMVEAFDPHEPFDSPKEYLDLYNDSYTGPRFEWPKYGPVNEPDDASDHLRKRYAANLTMIDRWFGKLLDTMDEFDMWDDTLVILTSDHGHLLGEHGFWGKNIMHIYNELAHIPLIVHAPGGKRAGEKVDALTQNIDLMPTLLDYFGLEIPGTVRGYSLMDIINGAAGKVRDGVIYGYHGMAVNITDGVYTYLKAPAVFDNHPCYSYTAMPTTFRSYMGCGNPLNIDMGRFLRYTDYPVFRFPMSEKDKAWTSRYISESCLFDLKGDYRQENPIKDEAVESELCRMMTSLMLETDCPYEQFERMGLTRWL